MENNVIIHEEATEVVAEAAEVAATEIKKIDLKKCLTVAGIEVCEEAVEVEEIEEA